MGKEILQQIREEMERSYRPPDLRPRVEQAQSGAAASMESAGLRSALSALQASYALVGQTPPEPPTLRGRIGARLIKLVQRLLFWYTPQIVHFQYSALRAFEEQAKSLQGAAGIAGELKAGMAAAAAHTQSLERQLAAEIAAREALVAQVEGIRHQALARIAELEMAHGLASETERRAREALERELWRLKPQQIAQERRIALLLEEARKRWPEPFDAAQMQRLGEEQQHNLDGFYLALEDEFRGNREDIKARLSVYLPKLAEAGIGSQALPLLDVGCGRGEWLEVLRDRQLRASGVDLNRVMVALCQERGLEVVEADAIGYLKSLPVASLGAVTAFHLIEHLPLARLFDLLDAAVRALKPGGVAIFETPNPNNVWVGARNFYMDPTHHHPIPPLLGQFLVEASGLRRVEILELNPCSAAQWVDTRTDGDVGARFNAYFYGPQDYAIIGWKV